MSQADPVLSRRKLLSAGATAGGVILLGGLWFGNRALARERLRSSLTADIATTLTAKAKTELTELPAAGARRIKTFFHGPCLNAHSFAQEVASESFRRKIDAVQDPKVQQSLVTDAFYRHVITPNEIHRKVKEIFLSTASELDGNWNETKEQIASKWGVSCHDLLELKPLNLGKKIDAQIDKIIESVKNTVRYQKSLLRYLLETGVGVAATAGAVALLLTPATAPIGEAILPAVITYTISKLAQFILSLFVDLKVDIQTRVTSRLSTFANTLATEFQQEMRRLIADLHRWQDQALGIVRDQLVDQALPFVPFGN